MSKIICEVCGKPASVHVWDADPVTSLKTQRHYCTTHAPQDVRALMPTRARQLEMVDDLIRQLEASPLDPAEKAEHRKELEQLKEDVAAGRRGLFDDSD